MTKSKALAMVKARLDPRGRVVWLGQKPDASDRIALLGYWPQLRRPGRRTLDIKQAREFLTSLGFETLGVPRDLAEFGLEGSGEFAWTHPCGDEFGATLADDILEGRVTVAVMQRCAQQDAAKVKHENDVFNHGHVELGRGHTTITHQNRRRTS